MKVQVVTSPVELLCTHTTGSLPVLSRLKKDKLQLPGRIWFAYLVLTQQFRHVPRQNFRSLQSFAVGLAVQIVGS